MSQDDSKNKNSIEVVAIHSLYSKILKRNGNINGTSKGIFGSLINAINP